MAKTLRNFGVGKVEKQKNAVPYLFYDLHENFQAPGEVSSLPERRTSSSGKHDISSFLFAFLDPDPIPITVHILHNGFSQLLSKSEKV
jgi:hypothetical protein